jgi:predicted transcriptional regulator
LSLKDTRFLSELSKEYNIPVRTLNARINKLIEEGTLIEFEDYRKAEGRRGTYILTKEGIEKIIGGSK